MSEQLRFSTLRISSTLPDLSQRQVLSNLARIAYQPTALPYFALITDGLANVKDEGGFGAEFESMVGEFTKGTFTPETARSVDGNWSLKPTVNPDRLLAMRGAYHAALGIPFFEREETMLELYLGKDWNSLLPTKFVHSGTWRDVPKKEAIYVDNFNGYYIWVLPAQAEEFAKFVLLILKLYLNQPGGITQNDIAGRGRPQPYPYLPDGVVTPDIPPIPRPSLPNEILTPDLPPQPLNRGLFFIPR